MRDLRGQQHVDDQSDRRHQVEEAVREHGPDERGPRSVGAPLQPELPRQHRDPRELADPARKHRIGEQADREGREHEREARVRRWHRLRDHRPPGVRPHEHRDEVETDREDDPFPAHGVERVPDRPPVRPAPPEERADPARGGEHDDPANDRRARNSELHASPS